MSDTLRRYTILCCWIVVLIALLLIPLRIIGYGYLPMDDCLRHAAQAVSGKAYTETIVLRPEYTMSHNAGWDWLLKQLHSVLGWDKDTLVCFSCVALMLAVLCAALPFVRHPEAWLGALLLLSIAMPGLIPRLTRGRPYLFTEAVLIAVLFAWSENKAPSRIKFILTCIGMALSTWIHGAFYLWLLPLFVFFLARWWRAGLWLAVCWGVGTFCGAMLTGKPFVFLKQALWIAYTIQHEAAPQWLLVTEFQPFMGEISVVVAIGLVFAWARHHLKSGDLGVGSPVVWLLAICWILGFHAMRFWVDWGIPAALVWLTLIFDRLLSEADSSPLRRLGVCGLLAAPLVLYATADLNRRYSYENEQPRLEASNPAMKEWLPGTDGILYCADMRFYHATFYSNPTGDWRYIVGFEPVLMPEADLKVFRRIARFSDFAEYEPWIKKMRVCDRLALTSSVRPPLTQLEWTNVFQTTWVGRLPR